MPYNDVDIALVATYLNHVFETRFVYQYERNILSENYVVKEREHVTNLSLGPRHGT